MEVDYQQVPHSHTQQAGPAQDPFASSGELTSLASSSNPSIQPAPERRVARAKATYSRKPFQDPLNTFDSADASSSSLPTSPAERVFDSPVRSHARHEQPTASNDEDRLEEELGDVTTNTEVSPDATAIKNGQTASRASLFRRIESFPSDNGQQEHESDDDGNESLSKKFQFGMAKAIYDSDSNDDDHQLATEDTDALRAKIRAQAAKDTESDPFEGSLSSVPPSSSQFLLSNNDSDDVVVVGRKLRAQSDNEVDDNANEEDEDDDDFVAARSRRRGGKVMAMRARDGKVHQPSKFTSNNDEDDMDGNVDEEEDQRNSLLKKKQRTFKLVSSSSLPEDDDQDASAAHSSLPPTTMSRRDKMEALAAKARTQRNKDPLETGADPLLDEFFADIHGVAASRSPSLDIQSSDDEENNDAMPSFMTANPSRVAKPHSRKHKSTERDVLSDLEGDFAAANQKVKANRASASAAAKKDKQAQPPKVKPLTKKELQEMHRETARFARENRTKLAPSHKKTIGIQELLRKIDASRADADLPSSDQSSSLIPSVHSRSQHASDPIESDPIKEKSSPYNSSSPVVPMSRQQERRLGLDPSSSNADATIVAPVNVPRTVIGLATSKPDSQMQFHDDADEDHNLPDISAMMQASKAKKEEEAKMQQMRQWKLQLLQRSQYHATPSAHEKGKAKEGSVQHQQDQAEAEDDDLIVYKPGTTLASKHKHLPTTPGKKRPTDLLYKDLGIKPNRTTPGRKSYHGTTTAGGSPNGVVFSSPSRVDGQDQQDDEDLTVTDSQLRASAKLFGPASDLAAGKLPVTQVHHLSTNDTKGHDADVPQDEKPHPRKPAAPIKMTQDQLNATLVRKMQTQNLHVRTQKEAKARKSGPVQAQRFAEEQEMHGAHDVKAMIEGLKAAEKSSAEDEDRIQDAEDDEDDPDFIMPQARDAESVIGSDIDMGSASEAEIEADRSDVEDEEDQIDFGSGNEDGEEEGDSEKENAPPSQQSQSSQPSRGHLTEDTPGRSRHLPPSRAVMDDDEDQVQVPRVQSRRARLAAFADDDEDGDEQQDPRVESSQSLQPGPFAKDAAAARGGSQSQDRVPLGDISSQSLGHSFPRSRSNTSSPVAAHIVAPASAVRRDPIMFPVHGQDEDDSFRTDDIPSSLGNGFSQFFVPTMQPPSSSRPAAVLQHRLQPQQKSFWDQTQTQSQSQSQIGSEPRAPVNSAAPELDRSASANSALGAFFQETQQESLRGESLDIFENSKIAGGKVPGFTQLFFDGTPPPTGAAGPGREGAGVSSSWDASSMPPPKSTEVDAFAALRKAQMGEAMDLLEPTPSVLPSLDESQAEREAFAQAQAAASWGETRSSRSSPEKMYLNKEGFFTQTKPSQQASVPWTQYDSQTQSQSQDRGTVAASGAMESPVAMSSKHRNPFASLNPNDSQTPFRTSTHHPKGLGIREDNASSDDEREEDVVLPVQRRLKRLRRGGDVSREEDAVEDEEEALEDADRDPDGEHFDEGEPPLSQNSNRPRNAFDVLRDGPRSEHDSVPPKKKRKSAFVEGEAEESEDEEFGGKAGAGGLQGVFDNDRGSAGGSEDEDDEDDADAEDLQELVDNEKEEDEAEKDLRARERFREDMEAQDRLDLEIHQKAIQGAFRTSRRSRGAGLGGLDDILDDEADEEELRRRAMMAPGFAAWKKRKVDGDEDGMDALAANEDAKAFLAGYAATHRVDHETDNYGFLAAPPDQDDEDSDEDDEKSGREDEEDEDVGQHEEPEEDSGPRKMTHNEFLATLKERRRAKKRGVFDDDEHEEEVEDHDEPSVSKKRHTSGNQWDSDDDMSEQQLSARLRDRLKEPLFSVPRAPAAVSAIAPQTSRPKKATLGMRYGRNKEVMGGSTPKEANQVAPMDVDPEHGGGHDSVPDDGDDDDDDELGADGPSSLLNRLMKRRSVAPTSAKNQKVSTETLDDAEPEWGNDANIVRAPKPSTTSGSHSSRISSSSASRNPFARKATDGAKVAKRSSSLLLGKQNIMRRDSGFSTSSSSTSQ